MPQQFTTVDTAKSRIGIGKMFANITECAGAQQGITQRVQQHIAIGMRNNTARVRNRNAAQHDMIAVTKTVNIVTMPYAQRADLHELNSE
jgi:tRNA splicing ligase